jgi:hypothetical protein
MEVGYFTVMFVVVAAMWLRTELGRRAEATEARRAPIHPSVAARVWFDAALVGLTLIMAYQGWRFIPLAAIALTLPLAASLDAWWRLRERRSPPAAAWITVAACLLAAAGAAYPMIVLGFHPRHPFYPRESVFEREIGAVQLPVAAADFLRVNGFTGPVFHTYTAESYLRWAVPGVQVGCGGRAQQVYTEDDLRTRRAVEDPGRLGPADMQFRRNFFDRYRIGTILLPAHESWPLILALLESRRWTPVYFDGDFCVLIRAADAFAAVKNALAADFVAVVDPKGDPADAAGRRNSAGGKCVFPSEIAYRRSRAMFLASELSDADPPSGSVASSGGGASWESCREAIERAQAQEPTPLLYSLLDRRARRRAASLSAARRWLEAERDRLSRLPTDGAYGANLLICRLSLCSILERAYRDDGRKFDRQAMQAHVASLRRELDRLAFWWQW